MKAVKTIAALIFLSALAIVLVQPVLDADDEPPRAQEPAGTPPVAGKDDQGPAHPELISRYPKRCMGRTQDAPTGLLAARRGSVAEVGFADGRPVARVDVSGDVAWSPSGTFLAERGGRVFDQSGNPQGALFFEAREWEWSPVADCALATTERGRLTFGIPDTRRRGVRLLSVPVEEFELSPNGRRLAVVVDGQGLWIADLRRGRIVPATGGAPSIVGWFSNRSVLYSKSEGSGKLRFAIGSGKTAIVRGAFAGGTFVRCGGSAFLVSAATEASPPLVELVATGGGIRRRVLDGPPAVYDGYSSLSCSPGGRFLAASTWARGALKGPLLLIERDGTFVRELHPGRTANPQWSDEGLLFARFGRGGRGTLWLIAPGAARAVRTTYRVGAPNQYDWHVR